MSSVGVEPYGGITETNEKIIASGLPASIQQDRQRGTPLGRTPSDAPSRSGWVVFVPSNEAALGLVTERDIIVDDLGKRYMVIAAYWNSLGYKFITELLEA
jgi:hypothetical protein